MKKLVFCFALILAMFSSPSIDYAEARGGGGGASGTYSPAVAAAAGIAGSVVFSW